MDNELTTIALRIGLACGPADVFGALSGSSDEQLRAARLIFHSLSKIIHPDRYTLPADRQVAHDTMTRLNGLWGEARFLIKAGRYTDRTATSPTVRITTRKRPYEVGALLGTDEVCQHYVCQFEADVNRIFFGKWRRMLRGAALPSAPSSDCCLPVLGVALGCGPPNCRGAVGGPRDRLAESAWKVRLVARPSVVLLDRVAQQYIRSDSDGRRSIVECTFVTQP